MKIKPIHLLTVILISLLFQLKELNFPLGFDESLHAYIGSNILPSGKLPYSDIFDQKPPIQYVPYYISHIIFGDNWHGVRMTGIFLSVVGDLFLFSAISILWSSPAGIISVLAVETIGNPIAFESLYSLQSEQFLRICLCFFLFWVAVSGRYKSWYQWLVSGFIGSMFFLVKPTFIIFIPASFLVCLILFKNKKVKLLHLFLSFLIGAILLPLVISIPYGLKSQLNFLFEGIWEYNKSHYLFGHKPTFLQAILEIAGTLGKNGLIVIFISFFSLLGTRTQNKRQNLFLFIVYLYLISGLISVCVASPRLFPHYFLMIYLPVAILLSSVTFVFIKRRLWFVVIISLAVTLLFNKPFFRPAMQSTSVSNSYFRPSDDLSVKKWATHESTLLAGSTAVYYYLYKIKPVGRFYISELPFWPDHEEYLQEFMSSLANRQIERVIIAKNSDLLKNSTFNKLILSSLHIQDQSDNLLLFVANGKKVISK